MGAMPDYDKDCEGKKPKGCMCLQCCEENVRLTIKDLMKQK